MSPFEEERHVLVRHDRIQLVVPPRPPNKEGSSTSKKRADDRQVEIVACDDVREGEAEAEAEPRDEQVVEVRLMAREKDKRLLILGS